MSFGWEAVAARARGLAAHLLDDDALGRLGETRDRSTLVEIMGATPYREAFQRPGEDPQTLDVAVARSVERRIALLARWMRPREDLILPVLLVFDARALRGIVRGIPAGIPPDDRIAESIATSTLDRGALRVLAGAESIGSVAATLSAWGHPLAPGLVEASALPGRLDLFGIEAALGRALGRAMTDAGRRGDGPMRVQAKEEIDVWNVTTALALSSTRPEREPTGLFLEGGAALTLRDFLRAAAAEGPRRCSEILASATAGTFFSALLADAPTSASAAEDRIVDARIRRASKELRRRPLSSVPVLLFLLRLRREERAVRRAVWRTSLPTRRRP